MYGSDFGNTPASLSERQDSGGIAADPQIRARPRDQGVIRLAKAGGTWYRSCFQEFACEDPLAWRCPKICGAADVAVGPLEWGGS